ncbi:hypothetical protein BGX23_011840 [Mortierella sp. AD031]|nr:hypothetical protein BGX23_011840 [Mortierella sp. AD031]
MAPIRRSRRLEQRATDQQEAAQAATSAVETTAPAASTTATKRAKATKTKKAVTKGKAQATTTTTEGQKDDNTNQKGDNDGDVLMKAESAEGDDVAAAAGDANVSDVTPATKSKATRKPKEKTTTVTTTPKGTKSKASGKQTTKTNGKQAKTEDKTNTQNKEGEGDTVQAETPTTKAKRTKKDKAKDDTTATASSGHKKHKVDPGQDDNLQNGDQAASTQEGPAPKKQRKGKKGAETTATAPPVPIVINKTDPYSVLPTELWQEVLPYLSLSQLSKISTVSKNWLEGTRSLQVWRDICEKGNLGQPKKKYRTHMALVCSQSYWICEQCLSHHAGKNADIPLPVEIEELAGEKRMLCHPCRLKYFRKHPEEIKRRSYGNDKNGNPIYENNKITKTDACAMYYLTDEDLWSVDCETRQNPHYRYAAPMRLFLEEDVQARALEVHGGRIGASAVSGSYAKNRREAAKKRAQGMALYVHLTPPKKKAHSSAVAGTNASINARRHMAKVKDPAVIAAAEEKYKESVLHLLKTPGMLAMVKRAIAEADARIAAGQAPLVIKTTNPENKWLDKFRNIVNNKPAQREKIRKILQDFEAGVCGTQASSSTSAPAGAGAGPATGSTEEAVGPVIGSFSSTAATAGSTSSSASSSTPAVVTGIVTAQA